MPLFRLSVSDDVPVADTPDGEVNDLTALHGLARYLADESGVQQVGAPILTARSGLAGSRVNRILAALSAQLDGAGIAALEMLAEVIRSLVLDIENAEQAGSDRRDLAHFRLLHALAIGVFARRWSLIFADKQDRLLQILQTIIPLRGDPWWRRRPGSQDRTDTRRAAAGPDDWPRAVQRIADLAEESVGRAPAQPYLYQLRIYTLLSLDRAEEARKVLAEFGRTPWLTDQWKQRLSDIGAALDDPDWEVRRQLPRNQPAVMRLDVLCKSQEMLQQAGSRLSAILLQESGLEPLEKGVVIGNKLMLLAAGDYFPDDGVALIGDASRPEEPSIAGLRNWLKQRFGVVLPGISLNVAALQTGVARVEYGGWEIGDRSPAEIQTLDPDQIWPAYAAAPAPLRVLFQMALRQLDRFPPASDGYTIDERAEQEILLADREKPDAVPVSRLGSAEHASVMVARMRMGAARRGRLWGTSPHYTRRLLDLSDERALAQEASPGCIAMEEKALTALIARIKALPSPLALVVRDPSLRPLVRALLRDDLPEVAVLAIGELDEPSAQALEAFSK